MVRLSVSSDSPGKTVHDTFERGGASERNFPADLVMLSEIDEVRFSGIVLKPVNTLATESETVGLSVSALNPVKTLPRASDTVGVSVSALNPVNNLPVASERGGASERNFPADFVMLSVMPARLSSVITMKPKTRETTAGTGGGSQGAPK